MKKAKKLSLKQRAKKAGIPVQTVYDRRNAGWSESKALSTPVGKYTTRKPKKVTHTVKDYEVAEKKYKKALSDFESIKPRKVEPKKAPSTVTLKQNPIPIQKFEGKKTAMDSPRTVVISLAVILVIVILVVVNA